jgi:amino acid adenylation domain-containing protein
VPPEGIARASTAAPVALRRALASRLDEAVVIDASGPGPTTTWSGADLLATTAFLVAQLLAAGVVRGAIVGLHLPRGPHLVAAMLAVWDVGATYLPLDPGYPSERLAFTAADAGVQVVVSTVDDQAARALAPTVVVSGDHPRLTDEPIVPAAEPQGATADDDLAYLISTSGSTGRPKSVRITHRGLAGFLDAFDATCPPSGAPQRWAGVTTPNFDPSVVEALWALTRRHVLVVPPAAVHELGPALTAHGVTHLQGTPSLYRILLADRDGRTALAGLDAAFVGGEPLTPTLAHDLLDVLAPPARLVNLYGPTETTVWATAGEVRREALDAGDPITVGRPLPGYEVDVVDGEVVIGGPTVGAGYHARPDLTAASFVMMEGSVRYRTGDLARWTPDGRIVLEGRTDHQVKVRGHRIELAEVEAALEDAARRVGRPAQAVALLTERSGEAAIVAVLCEAPGASAPTTATDSELLRLSGHHLPAAVVPVELVHLDALPCLPNGKVDRRSLAESVATRSPSTGAVAMPGHAPATKTERTMAALWSDAMGRPVADVEADFFALGGHSLVAARLVASIRQRFGVEVPLAALVEHASVRAMAALVDTADANGSLGHRAWSPVVPITSRAGGPATASVPVVLVHGVEGNVVNFRLLAEELRTAGLELDMVGVQAVGLDRTTSPLATIDAMADRYLDALAQAGVDTSTVVLGGYSGGGIVAMEMARRVRSAGGDVRLVVLLDTFGPELDPPAVLARVVARVEGERAAVFRFAQRWVARRLGWGRGDERGLVVLPVAEAFEEALDHHDPAAYDGPVLLVRVRTRTRPWDNRWSSRLTDLSVRHVGGHHDHLLEHPWVEEVAAQLGPALTGLGAARPIGAPPSA